MAELSCDSWFGMFWVLSQLGSQADHSLVPEKTPGEKADRVKMLGEDATVGLPLVLQ